MRKNIILIFLIICFFVRNLVFAQETASLSPTLKSEKDEIQTLKEKIASKVAEIENKKGDDVVSGFVVSFDNKKIILQSELEKHEVKIDDLLTKFYKITGSKTKEIQQNDLEKGNYLLAVGSKTDNSLEAKEIYVDEKYLVKTGQITEINKDKYQLKIVALEKEEFLIDIEVETKQLILDSKTLNFERIGFSKIKEGDMVHFVVKKDKQEVKNNQFSALKIIIIPQELFVK